MKVKRDSTVWQSGASVRIMQTGSIQEKAEKVTKKQEDFSKRSGEISGGKCGKSDCRGSVRKRQDFENGQSGMRKAVKRPSADMAEVLGAAAVGGKEAFRGMDGGEEFLDACMTADLLAELMEDATDFLAAPVKNAAVYGRKLYCGQEALKAEKGMKKAGPAEAVRKIEALSVSGSLKAEETAIHGKVPEEGALKNTSRIHSAVPGAGISRKEYAVQKNASGAGISRKEFIIRKTAFEAGISRKKDAGISPKEFTIQKAASGAGKKSHAKYINRKTAAESADFHAASKIQKTVQGTGNKKADAAGDLNAAEDFKRKGMEWEQLQAAEPLKGMTGSAAGTGTFRASVAGDLKKENTAGTGICHVQGAGRKTAGGGKVEGSGASAAAGTGRFCPASFSKALSADKKGRKISGASGTAGAAGLEMKPEAEIMTQAHGRAGITESSGGYVSGIFSRVTGAAVGRIDRRAYGRRAGVSGQTAVSGAGIFEITERIDRIKCSSGRKTGDLLPEHFFKKKAGAVKRRQGMTAGLAGRSKKEDAVCCRGVKNSVRNRMIELFILKRRQEKKRSSAAGRLKDAAGMRFSVVVRRAVKYAGLFMAAVFLFTAVLSLPVAAVLAVIYNSPYAVCFPSISSKDTVQQVLSAFMEEFDRDVEAELEKADGYDRSERVYPGFAGDGMPDNFCDILVVYMVKYGNGDTASDMTERAAQNLKSVFEDMCSFSISAGEETVADGEGNEAVYKVKYVNIDLKTWQDMICVYGFNDEEREVSAELMKPENTALMRLGGGSGQQAVPGQQLLPEQFQAAVDAASDQNGKKVLEFALSKVGFPYSQELRDSGTHFDCSSLAFYAWKNAGVNISYHGSTTAAAEAQLCYDNNWLVHYDEMKPGDLIFYSYHKNGRFMDITHVAVYAGGGMAVEAANTRLGVVYRAVAGKNSIVMIGRPKRETGG